MSIKISLISLIKDHSVFVSHAQNKVAESLALISGETGTFESFQDAKDLLKGLSDSFSRSKAVVVCADAPRYLYLKKLLFTALSLESEASAEITGALQALGDEISAETAVSHALVPKDASVFLSEDGLFSGFAVRSGKQHLIVLPLDLKRLDSVIENGFAAYIRSAVYPAEIPADAAPEKDDVLVNAQALVAEGFCAAVAATKSAEFIKSKLSPVAGWENSFRFYICSEEKKEPTQKEYVAGLARQAREIGGCPVGIAISNVYSSEKEGGSLFVLVTVADNLRAKVAKVYARPGETPRQLVSAAVYTLFDMLCEYADAGGFTGFPVKEEDAGTDREEKKGKGRLALKLILSGILALILCLILIFFGGRMVKAVKDFSGRFINAQGTQLASTTAAAQDTSAESGSEISDDDLLSMLAQMPSYSTDDETTSPAESLSGSLVSQSTSGTTTKTQTSTTKPTTAAATTKATTTQKPATSAATTAATTTKPLITVNYDGKDYQVVEFLARTVAQEIGTGSPIEALKAQAVAAYTFAKSYGFVLTSSQSAFSKSFNMDPNSNVVKAAIAVAGKYLSYNNKPITAFYFASSAGQTVSSASVWGGSSIPYLSGGVASPETVSVSNKSYTADDIKALVDSYNLNLKPDDVNFKHINLQENPAEWIKIITADSAGYVSTIKIGDKEMRGYAFRQNLLKLGIKSHSFTFDYTPDAANPSHAGTFNFTVNGYGHGVGMSQKGAVEYANQGWTYDKILLHYYQPGVIILDDI